VRAYHRQRGVTPRGRTLALTLTLPITFLGRTLTLALTLTLPIAFLGRTLALALALTLPIAFLGRNPNLSPSPNPTHRLSRTEP
jgi:hypothetical protein